MTLPPELREAVARIVADKPELFSDDPVIAHRAASPYKLEVAREQALAKAYAKADAVLALLDPAIAELVEGLRPFAAFRLSGFTGEVLEVVNSDPERKDRRIEPIWTSHFRRAAQIVRKYTEKPNGT